jgi:hypothetical protein
MDKIRPSETSVKVLSPTGCHIPEEEEHSVYTVKVEGYILPLPLIASISRHISICNANKNKMTKGRSLEEDERN